LNFREWLGLVVLVLSAALVPVGMYVSRLFWAATFAGVCVGAWLLYTERMLRREAQAEGEGSGCKPGGREMPGDIQNYSGWRSGGRSESFEGESNGGGEGD
jgi:hypothetical protein